MERAEASNASNIVIMQHYPEQARRLKDLWNKHRAEGRKEGDTVWTVFGHAHIQKCNGYDSESGACDEILSGGGGGCCMERSLRGFYVIGFDDDGNMIQPLPFNDTAISCPYPCDESVELSPQFMIEQGFETCCHTHDAAINCALYDLKLCKA